MAGVVRETSLMMGMRGCNLLHNFQVVVHVISTQPPPARADRLSNSYFKPMLCWLPHQLSSTDQCASLCLKADLLLFTNKINVLWQNSNKVRVIILINTVSTLKQTSQHTSTYTVKLWKMHASVYATKEHMYIFDMYYSCKCHFLIVQMGTCQA